MAAVQAEQLGDLITTTINELGEMKFTEIATDLQDHAAMSELMRKDRVVLDAGPQVQWDLMVQHSNSARNVGLGASDNVNIVDGMIQGKIPWRHSTTNWGVIRQEVAMNRSPRQIVSLIKARRLMALIAMAELMENNFWRFPLATDTETPYGVPYWVTKNASEGFNGGIPSGYTAVAEVSPTTYPRWNNWTYQYTDVSKNDFIRHVRQAAVKTDFKPPVDGIPTFNTGNKYRFFTNYAVIATLEEVLESQNMSLGNDIASKDGMVTFLRQPVRYVPRLDEDTTNPFYGLNMGVYKTYILRGEWLNETRIDVTPGQHTVATTHLDCSYQFICKDRRRNFVVATGVTYP